MKAARIIAILLIVLSVLTVSLAITARVMEKRLGPVILKELNEQLNAEIKVEHINFSIIKKFPHASIELSEVCIYSSQQFINKNVFPSNTNNDTLFYVKKAFLEFNAIDVFKRKYNIKSIYLNNGDIRFLIDKNGLENYRIFNKADAKDKEINIDLSELSIKNIEVLLVNQIKDFRSQANLRNFSLTGKIQSDTSNLMANGDIIFKNLKIRNMNYILNRNTELRLNIRKAKDNYQLNNSFLKLSGIKFFTSGSLLMKNTPKIQLNISASDAELNSIIHLLPEKHRIKYKKYEAYGNFSFNTAIEGEISKTRNPRIQFIFSLEDGSFINNKTNIVLSDLAIKGKYSNGYARSLSSSAFDLKQFSFSIDSSYFKGTCSINNFESPALSLNSDINIDLAQLQEFFKIDTIETASGNLRSKFWLDARFTDIQKPKLDELHKMKLSGETYLEDAELKIRNNTHHLTDINSKTIFADNDLRISSLSFVDGASKFSLEGLITNFIPWLLIDSQNVFIDANLFSEYFDLDNYLFTGSTLPEESQDSVNLNLPDNVSFSLGLDMNNFEYRKFRAHHLKGLLHYQTKTLTADEITFHTMTGMAFGSGNFVQNKDSSFHLSLDSKLDSIDINQLFYSFGNFGQEFLLQENIAGKISGDIKFGMSWDKQLSVLRDDIFAEGELIIRNGELIDFEPLQSLSRFADVDELKRVRFSELKNTIYINNQKVIIPQMIISSSAFNMGVSGVHTFDNNIDYHISVLLSEVLSKRFKPRKSRDDEFTNIEDDGLGRTMLYFAITGTVDDYDTDYDRKKVRNKLRENLKEERKEIKSIIQEEFSKTDSTERKRKRKTEETPQMIFEFEGDTIR